MRANKESYLKEKNKTIELNEHLYQRRVFHNNKLKCKLYFGLAVNFFLYSI